MNTQQIEEQDYSFNSQFDYASEAFGDMRETREDLDYEMKCRYQDQVKTDLDAMETRGGPDYYFPCAIRFEDLF